MSIDQEIIAALRTVLNSGRHALHEPSIKGNEQKYVQDCIASTYVSSVGEYVNRFENELANFTGANYAVAVSNGTAALHVALRIAGVERDDEVLVPSLTFTATPNAVSYLGASPHFIDVEERTMGVDPLALDEWLKFIAEPAGEGFRNRITGKRLRALLPMHTFGHPCAIDKLLDIARKYYMVLIEDAAESLGSYYHNQHTGTFGLLGIFSFNGNKIITTGGGGAIITGDKGLADYARHLTTTAKQPHQWDYYHDDIGYNFRMPNLNAAFGCAQIERLSEYLASKRRLTTAYEKAFSGLKSVKLMREPSNCRSNYWLQTIVLNELFSDRRDLILSATNNVGIMTRPAWVPMHYLHHYMGCQRAPLPVTESLANRIINLPSSAGIV